MEKIHDEQATGQRTSLWPVCGKRERYLPQPLYAETFGLCSLKIFLLNVKYFWIRYRSFDEAEKEDVLSRDCQIPFELSKNCLLHH